MVSEGSPKGHMDPKKYNIERRITLQYSPTTMPRTLFLMCKASNNKATKSMSVETLMKQLENDQRASPDFAPNVV